MKIIDLEAWRSRRSLSTKHLASLLDRPAATIQSWESVNKVPVSVISELRELETYSASYLKRLATQRGRFAAQQRRSARRVSPWSGHCELTRQDR